MDILSLLEKLKETRKNIALIESIQANFKILQENANLYKEKSEIYQEKSQRYEEEIKELKEKIKTIQQHAKVSSENEEYIPYSGILFKKTNGQFLDNPFCPNCKSPMGYDNNKFICSSQNCEYILKTSYGMHGFYSKLNRVKNKSNSA